MVSLPKTLGKAFYKSAKTTPISVRITPDKVGKVVEEAFGKSYVRKNSGNCVVVRVGFVGMGVEALIENCVALWKRCVVEKKLVQGGSKGVRSGFVKSIGSIALPVWMTDSLFSENNVLTEEEIASKKVKKSKAERKLLAPSVEEKEVEDEIKGSGKRGRDEEEENDDDDVEKSFEKKRARKLAKQETSKSPKEGKGVKPIKVKVSKAVKV